MQARKQSQENSPLKIALTGGIGAGKSTVAKVFEVLGIPVFNADDVAKSILVDNKDVRQKIVDLFGADAYVGDELNRTYLAEKVFTNDDHRNAINDIVHPAVGAAFANFYREHSESPYVIKEAAITIEIGMHEKMDAVVLVTGPEELRIQRVMKRSGMTRQSVLDRMASQRSDSEKRKYANFEIINDDLKPIIPSVLQIHHALIRSYKQR